MSLKMHERDSQDEIDKSRPLVLQMATRKFVNDYDGALDDFAARDEVVEVCREHGLNEVHAVGEKDAVPVEGRDRARWPLRFFDGKQLNGEARANIFDVFWGGLAEPYTNAC